MAIFTPLLLMVSYDNSCHLQFPSHKIDENPRNVIYQIFTNFILLRFLQVLAFSRLVLSCEVRIL